MAAISSSTSCRRWKVSLCLHPAQCETLGISCFGWLDKITTVVGLSSASQIANSLQAAGLSQISSTKGFKLFDGEVSSRSCFVCTE